MRNLMLALCIPMVLSCNGEVPVTVVADPVTTPSTPAEAATAIANENAACLRIQPFYWEVGDADGPRVTGTAGGPKYNEDTPLSLASATKWMFASYVLERFSGEITDVTRDALRMLSGNVGFKILSCRNAETVGDCLAESETQFEASYVGTYYYDGGHFQQWSVDHGLGAMSNDALAGELQQYLGSDVPLAFVTPQPAGGIRATPKAYAQFLRKILRGDLKMGGHLGKDAVCTLPAKCQAAQYSPAPEDVHYSYGHWVEDDPENGDGAFSSAGLFGFYPWISADKKWYGVLARQAFGLGESWNSLVCGREIRKAYVSFVK